MKEKLITLLLLVAASMNWIGCSKQQANPEIAADSALTQFIDENYVYIHVLYAGKDDAPHRN